MVALQTDVSTYESGTTARFSHCPATAERGSGYSSHADDAQHVQGARYAPIDLNEPLVCGLGSRPCVQFGAGPGNATPWNIPWSLRMTAHYRVGRCQRFRGQWRVQHFPGIELERRPATQSYAIVMHRPRRPAGPGHGSVGALCGIKAGTHQILAGAGATWPSRASPVPTARQPPAMSALARPLATKCTTTSSRSTL